MKRNVTPACFRRPMWSKSCLISRDSSRAVGSSRMMKRLPLRSARAISRRWRSPTVSSPATWSTSTSSPQTSSSRRPCRRSSAQLIAPAARGRLIVEEQILADRQVRNDRRFLVDAGDLRPPDRPRRNVRRGLAREADLAGVGAVEAGHQPHQGRLAGAVPADERQPTGPRQTLQSSRRRGRASRRSAC